jgi:hypothetical protein
MSGGEPRDTCWVGSQSLSLVAVGTMPSVLGRQAEGPLPAGLASLLLFCCATLLPAAGCRLRLCGARCSAVCPAAEACGWLSGCRGCRSVRLQWSAATPAPIFLLHLLSGCCGSSNAVLPFAPLAAGSAAGCVPASSGADAGRMSD